MKQKRNSDRHIGRCAEWEYKFCGEYTKIIFIEGKKIL